jgi:hypothetical protein
MRARLSTNGKLSFSAEGSDATPLYVQFGTHLQKWTWRTPSAGEWVEGDLQTVRCTLDGVDGGTITVNNTVSQLDDGAVVMEVTANAEPIERGVCSLCMHIMLAAPVFEGGSVSGLMSATLSSDPPTDNHNPFSTISNRYNEMPSFTLVSKDKRIAVEVSTDNAPVSFVDIRKWGPQFDVRIGDSAKSPFDFQSNHWRLVFRFLGAKCRLLDFRFPAIAPQVLENFHRDGFTLFERLVPQELIDDAVRMINSQLGEKPGAELKQSDAPIIG